MYGQVFSKTEAGVQEVHCRQLKLAPRVRNLLVMVNGQQTVNELLTTLGPLGVKFEHFSELYSAGLIHSPVRVAAHVLLAGEPSEMLWAVLEPARDDAADPNAQSSQSREEDAERILALYRVCNDVIRAHFGLRGLSFQLQLERAATLADYLQLGRSLYAALKRGPGLEVAAMFKQQIRPLLV